MVRSKRDERMLDELITVASARRRLRVMESVREEQGSKRQDAS